VVDDLGLFVVPGASGIGKCLSRSFWEHFHYFGELGTPSVKEAHKPEVRDQKTEQSYQNLHQELSRKLRKKSLPRQPTITPNTIAPPPINRMPGIKEGERF
jgi:hypothetical protein